MRNIVIFAQQMKMERKFELFYQDNYNNTVDFR